MFGALARHDRAGRGAGCSTDGGARTAAGDPADDGAEAGAGADLASGLLALTRALRLDVGRDDSYFRPPNDTELAFKVSLSAPLIVPACSTLTACSATAAPRPRPLVRRSSPDRRAPT